MIKANTIIEFNDDGGWCWFQDKRAIIVNDCLILTSVASGYLDEKRQGNIEITSYNFHTQEISRVILHKEDDPLIKAIWCDDHSAPSICLCEDNHILVAYCRHHKDNKIYYRRSSYPFDASTWEEEKIFIPSEKSRVTYSNLFQIIENGKSKVYNFYRGFEGQFKPSWSISEDDGVSFIKSGLLIDFKSNFLHRPYIKFALNNRSCIHFAYTEGHPRDFNNSIFHAYYQDGWIYKTDGRKIRMLKEGPMDVKDGTLVFTSDQDNVAWISDLHVAKDNLPYLAFSVQKNSAGLPRGDGGLDHRYHYAYFDGTDWQQKEIAYAGTRIYAGEDDYTGLITLDSSDKNIIFISSNVNPNDGKSLISNADNKNHYEIFMGKLNKNLSCEWYALTTDSSCDNLRPIVVENGSKKILIWLSGKMTSYTNYKFKIVGMEIS